MFDLNSELLLFRFSILLKHAFLSALQQVVSWRFWWFWTRQLNQKVRHRLILLPSLRRHTLFQKNLLQISRIWWSNIYKKFFGKKDSGEGSNRSCPCGRDISLWFTNYKVYFSDYRAIQKRAGGLWRVTRQQGVSDAIKKLFLHFHVFTRLVMSCTKTSIFSLKLRNKEIILKLWRYKIWLASLSRA